ncbi:MAG: NUDIX hydrolase [Candidatus Sericytochromatia bacterium]
MPAIQFCPACGGPVQALIPPGDNRMRPVCSSCDRVHYQNPNVVVGCVAYYQEGYLLCRRAIEPRSGFWTIPAGYLELNESTEEGALREAQEESGAQLEIRSLLAVYNLPHLSQVQLLYLAEMTSPALLPGEESLEAAIFAWTEIPWSELAFPTVYWALHHARLMRQNRELSPDQASEKLLRPAPVTPLEA